MAAETATTRLTRLLTMVPWLVNRQGIELGEAAHGLGVTVEQLEADWEEGRVFVGNADTISRPLRLGVDEAVTLIVGLRTLLDVPGLTERDAIERALAKLEAAAGSAAEPAARVSVDLADGGVDAEILGRAREGVRSRRRLHLTYHVPGRDESTERDVDPMRVIASDGHWYLEGWCHRADGVRMFRVDRVEALELLDEDGTPPEGASSRDLGDSIFSPGADDLVVTLRLERGARWISDYYPVESVLDEGDARTITLRTADTAWLERLVLRMGGHAVLTAPEDLRDRIAARAYAALESPTHDVD